MTANHISQRSIPLQPFGNQDPILTPQKDVKAKLLESKVSESKDFFRLSDGFKQLFGNDKKDKNMVIPIVGFGGHRRGDRC